ncbi:MAG TPA: hypothetical protein VK011_00140 [Acidimicrobiia bacterium]|nr:hypothetical protein [Acidimicrobiia bacterium]
MRRAHPLIYIAVWAVVTLLAVAGFAAFQTQGRPVPEPAAQTLGREVGALAGMGFNAPPIQVAVVAATSTEDEEAAPLTADQLLSGEETETESPLDTVPTHGWLSEMQVRAIVSRYFKAEDVNRAIRVAWCQSRFNPTSSDPRTGGMGLFHHLPDFWEARAQAVDFAGAEPSDPEANVAAAAYAVYEEGGWAVFPCDS